MDPGNLTGGGLNTGKNREYVRGYVFEIRVVTIYPTYKNFVLEISISGDHNQEEVWMKIIKIDYATRLTNFKT